MKNRYFQSLLQKGIQFRKLQNNRKISFESGLFSEGVSTAYKFWAIADRYNSSDIYIDELPDSHILGEFIATYRKASIKTFVISKDDTLREQELVSLGCRIADECKVFRREAELYNGSLEVIRGIRVTIER